MGKGLVRELVHVSLQTENAGGRKILKFMAANAEYTQEVS